MSKIQIDVLAVKKQAEKTMTTAQVAEAIGVSDSSVKRAVEKLGSVLGAVAKNTQGGFLFDEAQVTMIKQEIAKHHNLASRQIDTATTRLEVLANYKAATQAMIELLEAEKAELQAEKERIASERDKLAIELDSAKEWATVKRMEALNPKMRFTWRALKRYALENGYKMKDVFDQNYGTVKAYPRAVWEAVYGEQIDEAPWLE